MTINQFKKALLGTKLEISGDFELENGEKGACFNVLKDGKELFMIFDLRPEDN